jgi:hypothetical protein
MKTYSVLLKSLQPQLGRQELEEISVKIPSIARADCARISAEWFGILISGISFEDATAFQEGLRAKGCETDVVIDHEVPALHHDFRCQRLDLEKNAVVLTSSMGRRLVRPRQELVFVSCGFLDKSRLVSKTELQIETRHTGRGSYSIPVQKTVRKEEEKSFFRVDFFFASEPRRVSLETSEESVMFYGERLLRLRNTTEILVLMVDLQSLLPPERMNRGLRELSTGKLYPSQNAYHEELRWSFHRLGARG